MDRQLAGAEFEAVDLEVVNVNEGFDENLKEAPALGLAADAARTELVPRADRSIVTIIESRKYHEMFRKGQLSACQMVKYRIGN